MPHRPPPTVAERAKRRTANGPRAVHGKSEESWSGRAATAWSVCHLKPADRWQKIAAQPDRAFRNRIGRATPEGAIRPRRFATTGGVRPGGRGRGGIKGLRRTAQRPFAGCAALLGRLSVHWRVSRRPSKNRQRAVGKRRGNRIEVGGGDPYIRRPKAAQVLEKRRGT